MNEQYNPFFDNGQSNEEEQNNQQLFNAESPQLNQTPETAKVVSPWFERFKGVIIVVIFFLTQLLGTKLSVSLIKLNSSAAELKSIENIGDYLPDLFTGSAIAEGLLMIILAIYYRKPIANKFKAVFGEFSKFIVKIIGYFALLMIITNLLGTLDLVLFPQYANEAGNNQALIEKALTTPTLSMLFSICISAPFIEEFVFRYGFIKKLLYGMNKYVAAIVAALIFSFAHIGFSQATDLSLFIHLMLGYIGQALVFGIIYVREDNILYPVVIHFLNNTQAVIIITLLSAS